MPPPRDDHTLLRAYVERGDDDAFAEVVARHADMVYGAALRQVGRGGMAEDVAQATFILLARKAGSIGDRVVVAAWLHKATRYTALNAMKIEKRRRAHEHRAGEQLIAAQRAGLSPAAATTNVSWAKGAALLDEGVARLDRADREAVILRFLERRSFADVGTALGVSEEAAQMRVKRAIEKLRGFFRRRGLLLSSAALRASVSAHAFTSAPAAWKGALAPAARLAARDGLGSSPANAMATGAARSMKIDAIRSVSTTTGVTLATAALIALLLMHVPSRPAAKAPSPADTATRATGSDEDQAAPRSATNEPSRSALVAPFVAVVQRMLELSALR